ncbi:hypothetical protein SEA_NICEHOUSE_288 [Rhodococcus phage NiceHouse]|nr:hypothetical protein SEA_NICEHOUSE_7 [Rhodococcus phage NiceHouse]QLF83501.1 hypothetical protein SEA_NICEHOUSE_288 [Rhodococcus phage NiceHouse]
MNKDNHGTISVCQDCFFFFVNGDEPADWKQHQIESWLAEISKNLDGCNGSPTPGHFHDEMSANCFHYPDDCADDDCDCEHTDFSNHWCATCLTVLAGDRYDMTIWVTPTEGNEK